MGRRSGLGELEQLILLSILRLRARAFGPDIARDPAQDALESRNHVGMSARPAAKERPRGKISPGQVIYYNREAATEKNYKTKPRNCQYF